jgi:hypothetical protein
MAAVRRSYLFFVCLFSLQAVAWAVISLLRSLFRSFEQVPLDAIAFQIAVIVVGFPLYLAHWLWMQSLAAREATERVSAVRHLFLYLTLGLFLIPLVNNLYHLAETALRLLFGETSIRSNPYSDPVEAMLRNLAAIVVLGALWAYHQFIVSGDARAGLIAGTSATIRRLYYFFFSGVGVGLTTAGIVDLLSTLFYMIAPSSGIVQGPDFATPIVLVAMGLLLWLWFWTRAQRLFVSGVEEEQRSALRKFYLYAVVFVAVLGVVSNASLMLGGLLRRLLGLPAEGDVRGPLAAVLGLAIPWVYHTYVLRNDALVAREAPRQAAVRRLYLYLVAAVGFASLLVALAGLVSVLIRSLDRQPFVGDLREQLAWFTAALIVGLPVWLLPWRSAQLAAMMPEGAQERRSLVRRIYLYFYIFVATMSALSAAIYVVYQLLSLALGERGGTTLLSDLGHAVAFILIAVAVWLYHGYVLREDGRLARQEQMEQLSTLRVAVVDMGEGHFGRALLDRLRLELPGLQLVPVGLTETAAAAMGAPVGGALAEQLAGASIIAGPWMMAAPDLVGGTAAQESARTIAAAPARKLLVPAPIAGWEWVGTEAGDVGGLVQQTVAAVRQIVEGEEVRSNRFSSAGVVVLAILGALFLLCVLTSLFNFVPSLFY